MSAVEAKAPACRIGECSECPGPRTVRLARGPAWEKPVEQLRCGCPCHRRPQ